MATRVQQTLYPWKRDNQPQTLKVFGVMFDGNSGMGHWDAQKHSTSVYWTRCPWTPLVNKSKAGGGREQEIGAI